MFLAPPENLNFVLKHAFFSPSPIILFAKLFAWDIEDVLLDEESDAISFKNRLQEAATARAVYSRQSWEGKINVGWDLWTRLNLGNAMNIPEFAQDEDGTQIIMRA